MSDLTEQILSMIEQSGQLVIAELTRCREENAKLRAEVAELRADKERLDWLEVQNIVSLQKNALSNRWSVDSIQSDDYGNPTPFDGPLRAAIDAARQPKDQ